MRHLRHNCLTVILAFFLAGCVKAQDAPGASPATSVGAAPAALKVTIAIPEMGLAAGDFREPRTINDQQADAHFDVLIENVSSQAVYLWDEGNSMGYDNLSFEITEADGTKLELVRQEIAWAKNVFEADRLEPGESQVREVHYVSEKRYYAVRHYSMPLGYAWDPPFPFEINKQKTVTMRAIFEQKPEEVSTHWNWQPWVGRVVSAPYTVILYGTD
jgi:hypothetical protein